MALCSDVEVSGPQPICGCAPDRGWKKMSVFPGYVLHGKVEPTLTPKPLEAGCGQLRENVLVHELRRIAVREVLEIAARDVGRLELTGLLCNLQKIAP
jgi:hypothetical protein